MTAAVILAPAASQPHPITPVPPMLQVRPAWTVFQGGGIFRHGCRVRCCVCRSESVGAFHEFMLAVIDLCVPPAGNFCPGLRIAWITSRAHLASANRPGNRCVR